MPSKKYLRQIADLAKSYGRKMIDTGGHLKLVKDGKRTVICSKSPSDSQRVMKNIERDLKHND